MSTKQLKHRPERPVYTCSQCVNSIPQRWGLFCPVFDIEVKPSEKACIYRDVKKR